MSDTKTGDDNKSGASKRGTLSLKPRGPGTVRQNFSHGRSNSVVVETKNAASSNPVKKSRYLRPKRNR